MNRESICTQLNNVNNKERQRTKVANCFFILFFVLAFLNDALIKSGIMANMFTVGGALLLLAYVIVTRGDKYAIDFLTCSFLAVFFILSRIYNKNANLLEILWLFSYFGVALLLYCYDIHYNSARIIYYVQVIYFCVCIIRCIDPNECMNSGSRNTVSTVLLFSMTLYYIIRSRSNKSIDIFPAIFSLIISLWAQGRGGIIVSAFYFLIVIICRISKSKYKLLSSILTTIFMIIVSIACFAIFNDTILEVYDRFVRVGVQSIGRSEIIAEYTQGLKSNFFNVILGVPFGNYPTLNHYKNPHNSFIMLHAKFGIVGFCVFIYAIVKWMIVSLKKKRFFECAIVCCLILRAVVDWLAFPGMWDILAWYALIEMKHKGGRPIDGLKIYN